MSVRFPSLAFFQALREEMRGAQERFSRLGFFDTTFGVRVLDAGGMALFEGALGFEVFDCVLVREGLEGVTPDFVLEGPLPAWREMLDAIHRLPPPPPAPPPPPPTPPPPPALGRGGEHPTPPPPPQRPHDPTHDDAHPPSHP